MSDERGRGAADDERPRERRDAAETPAGEPEATEPEFGSADWLLQQLTGGRPVDRAAEPPGVAAPEVAAPDAAARGAAAPDADHDASGHADGLPTPPAPESPASEEQAWPFAASVEAQDPTPASSVAPGSSRAEEPSPFDDLLGSAIEEPEAAEEPPTEFPVAFNWNLTPGVGSDPLVERDEPASSSDPAATPFAVTAREPESAPTDAVPSDPTPTALFEPLGFDSVAEEPPADEPDAVAADAVPTDATPTALFEPLGVDTVGEAPAAAEPTTAPTAQPLTEPESRPASEPGPEDAEPPLVPPVHRSTFVEPETPRSAGIFAPFAASQEPPATGPSVTGPPSEPLEDEEPPAAVRSWVIEPALPTPPAEPERPRTIFDAPDIPAGDEPGDKEGHGLAALLGFGGTDSDAPSGRSVIGDTTSVIPIDPSAFTRPPAPSEPPTTPIGDALLPPVEDAAPATGAFHQPVLPPIDAAALFEPPIETPAQRQDAAEIADLLRASHEEPELSSPPAWTPAADEQDEVPPATQQLDLAEMAALLRDEPVEPLPSAPFPAAEAELAMGGLPSPATSPIDAESIARASEPEPEPLPEPFAPDALIAAGADPVADRVESDTAAAEADETAAEAAEVDETDTDQPDGLAELFGDAVELSGADADTATDVDPQGEAGSAGDHEPFDEAPEPAAGAEGPQLTATTPFAFTQAVPTDPTVAGPDATAEAAAAVAGAHAAGAASAAHAADAAGPATPGAHAADAAAPAAPGTRATAATHSAATDSATAATTAPTAPAGGGLWGSRNNRILFLVAGALAVVLVLIGLFAIGTRIPSWLGAGQPAPVATASASAKASPTPTPTPTPVPTVTPKPAAVGAGTHPWDALGGGECIQPFTTVWAEEFTVVDCASPHTAQLVYTNLLSADPAAPYPGADALAQQIPGFCTAAGVIDLGAAAAYPDLQVVGSFPATEAQWKSGQHSYYCFAIRGGGEPLTSSVAGPGPAA